MAVSKTETEIDPVVMLDELDWQSQEILRALLENGGQANTTELRALTGIDDNNPINYRYNNTLAPRGLVELTQPDAEGNKLLPKVASLTDRGETVAKAVIEHRGEATNIGDAVEEFNARVTRIESQLNRLDTPPEADRPDSDDFDELQEQIADLDTKLEALYTNMVRFRDYLNERDDGGFSDFVEQREQANET
jgi:archaellum component FlaC